MQPIGGCGSPMSVTVTLSPCRSKGGLPFRPVLHAHLPLVRPALTTTAGSDLGLASELMLDMSSTQLRWHFTFTAWHI